MHEVTASWGSTFHSRGTASRMAYAICGTPESHPIRGNEMMGTVAAARALSERCAEPAAAESPLRRSQRVKQGVACIIYVCAGCVQARALQVINYWRFGVKSLRRQTPYYTWSYCTESEERLVQPCNNNCQSKWPQHNVAAELFNELCIGGSSGLRLTSAIDRKLRVYIRTSYWWCAILWVCIK